MDFPKKPILKTQNTTCELYLTELWANNLRRSSTFVEVGQHSKVSIRVMYEPDDNLSILVKNLTKKLRRRAIVIFLLISTFAGTHELGKNPDSIVLLSNNTIHISN